MSALRSVSFGGSTDGPGFDFFGVTGQSSFIALEDIAKPEGGLRVYIIAGLTQLFGDAQQFDGGPSEVRRNALQVAAKFLFRLVKPHDDLLNVCARKF
jgi:hypothetical protein